MLKFVLASSKVTSKSSACQNSKVIDWNPTYWSAHLIVCNVDQLLKEQIFSKNIHKCQLFELILKNWRLLLLLLLSSSSSLSSSPSSSPPPSSSLLIIDVLLLAFQVTKSMSVMNHIMNYIMNYATNINIIWMTKFLLSIISDVASSSQRKNMLITN